MPENTHFYQGTKRGQKRDESGGFLPYNFNGDLWKRGMMDRKLDFEYRMKKLMKTAMTEEEKQGLDFVPREGRCTWMNAMCLSLAGKAAKGDINAIKYINEICSRDREDTKDGPVAITVKVIE